MAAEHYMELFMPNMKIAKTSNIERFLNGISALEERGAAEACMLLVTGKAGLGKTRAVQWWVAQKDAVYLRAKATWTPRRALSDLITELEDAPEGPSGDLFTQALKLLARQDRPVVIDEVEHALHDKRVIEVFRDLSDLLEFPLILVGMDAAKAKIKRLEQISSRIAAVVDFQPLTVEDVALLCRETCLVGVDGDLVSEIHRQSEGKVRGVKNALALIERHAARNKAEAVKLTDLHGMELVHDWQNRHPQRVNGNGRVGK